MQLDSQGRLGQESDIVWIIGNEGISARLRPHILAGYRGFSKSDLGRPSPGLALHISHLKIVSEAGLAGRRKNPVPEGNILDLDRFEQVRIILHGDSPINALRRSFRGPTDSLLPITDVADATSLRLYIDRSGRCVTS